MDPALYVSSMVTWQGTALTPSQHNQATEEGEISEEGEAEEAIETNIRTKREIDSYMLEYCCLKNLYDHVFV